MTLRSGLLLLAAPLLLLDACKQSDPAPAVTPMPPAGTLTARIQDNNQPFTAYQVHASNQGTILIEATRGTSELLRLQFPSSTSPGTYTFSTSAYTQLSLVQYGANPRDYSSFMCSSPSGNIQVTEVDATNNTISGTFAGRVCTSDGQTRLDVINGAFNKIQIQ